MPQIFHLRTMLPVGLRKRFGKSIASLRSVTVPLAIALLGGSTLLVVPGQFSPAIVNASFVIGSGTLIYWLGLTILPAPKHAEQANALSADAVALMMRDVSAVLVARDTGAIVQMNPAATALFSDAYPDQQGNIAQLLSKFTASPMALIARLSARAQANGSAHDEITTRDGAVRIVLYAQADSEQKIWRIDSLAPTLGGAAGADTLSLPMLTANKAGVVLYSNQALRKLLGKRPKHLNDLSAPESWRNGEELILAAQSGPVSVMLLELPSSGERREIYLAPLPAAQSPASLRTDFEIIPVPLAIFAPDGALRAANHAAREILGPSYRSGAYVHEMFDFLGRPVSDWLSDVAEGRLPQDTQFLRLNGGAEKNNFVQVSLRRMVESARPSVLAVIQDGNAIKTLEAQFVQSQKMQAIGQLAGGVAHDFNNLLTAISGNTDLLLLRHTGDDPSTPDLMQIRQNANRAAALVAQLLAFSRKQNLQPEYLDVQDVFSDLTHLLNRLMGEKLRLALHHGSGIGHIRADKRQLEQVIVNLVVNARDAMPSGGTITLTTEAVHLAADLARNRANVPKGDYAKITVADTGTGISEEILEKIFEPFFTTKRAGEGTGLGLSTAYGIVKQSGGFIFVDSALGQGTTFTLYFPIHNRPLGEVAAPAPKPAALRQGEGVVLLVEDEAPVRAFAARALRLRGYTVLEAESGEQALEVLRTGGMQVDLFISDVIMPGLDGPTWVREAQETLPNVPVIFVSGYAEDVMSEHQARITNATFLPKPFSLADLTLAVQDKLQPSAAS